MADIYRFSSRLERNAVARATSKKECIAASRFLLTRIAAWTTLLFDTGSASRLVEADIPDFRSDINLADFSEPGSAGPRIEQSKTLLHLSRAYDVVTTGRWQGAGQDFVTTHHELAPFHYLLRQPEALVDDVGEPLILPESAVATALSILDPFEARVYLYMKVPLDVRWLSALSGLSEKTVRMAAIGQDRNPDLVTFKEGTRTYVAVEEALRWLSTKPRFLPTVFVSPTDVELPEPQTDAELPAYLRSRRDRHQLSIQDLARLLDWDARTTSAYQSLEEGLQDTDLRPFTVAMLARMARVLAPDNRPGFVRAVGSLLHARRLEQAIDQEFPYDDSGAAP